MLAIVEIIPLTGARCGRSWFENINPDISFGQIRESRTWSNKN
jgi:hypothetical protein